RSQHTTPATGSVNSYVSHHAQTAHVQITFSLRSDCKHFVIWRQFAQIEAHSNRSTRVPCLPGKPHPLTPGPFSSLRLRRGARGEGLLAATIRSLLSSG